MRTWPGLHPDAVRLLKRFEENRIPPYEKMSVLEARMTLEAVTRLQSPPAQVASVYDILVPGAAGLLPARVYHPDPARSLPLVVYVHGGGWVLGSVTTADGPCRRLSLAGDCVVVSLEYRRAPETKFPGPLEDCVNAVRWLGEQRRTLGADPELLILLGDSAGGNLVAATTLCLRDRGGPKLTQQILLYPCLAPPAGSASPSYTELAEAPLMSRATMQWFWDHYLDSPGRGRDPLAAPLFAEDLSRLPVATIIVAEFDPLRDDGLRYADRLEAAGVEAVTTVVPGAIHGFWWMDAALSQAAELDQTLGALLRTCARR